eukprot:scaffold34821_cov36-Tisochrysis_lutea.AAC.2
MHQCAQQWGPQPQMHRPARCRCALWPRRPAPAAPDPPFCPLLYRGGNTGITAGPPSPRHCSTLAEKSIAAACQWRQMTSSLFCSTSLPLVLASGSWRGGSTGTHGRRELQGATWGTLSSSATAKACRPERNVR